MLATGRALSVGDSDLRHRLYFTLPDVTSAEQTIQDLLLARIEIPRIHCLARRGTPLGELPEANFLQKADVIQDAGIGIAFGGVLGATIGGLLMLFPPVGANLPIGTMPIGAILGAVFGVWASSVAGTTMSYSRITVFERGLARGNILLVVDVPFTRSREISDLVHLRHPAARFAGTESGIPATS